MSQNIIGYIVLITVGVLFSTPSPAQTNAPSVSDYYGVYSGKTASYHVKDKDGNEVLNNGSPVVVPAFDTTVKFTSTGVEVSEINDNSSIVSMLSQDGVQVNSIDGNSVTISVNVVESLNGRLSPSKPSYKFVFNKDGTGKMIPLSEMNAPTIDLTSKPKAATTISTNSDVPPTQTSTDIPIGDNYYSVDTFNDGTSNAIAILTRTKADFYLTYARPHSRGFNFVINHISYVSKNEDSDKIDYQQLECEIVSGAENKSKNHDVKISYTKSSDSYIVSFGTSVTLNFTKQEPADLQECIKKAKIVRDHADLVQNGAYFVTKQIESKVGPVNQISLYSDKPDETTNAEISYTVIMGDNTSHYVTVRGSKDNWKITDIDYKTP